MSDKSKGEAVPLKSMIVIKNRAAFTELGDISIDNLTEREKVLLRVINDLEDRLDKVQGTQSR
jgi:hypothetical protein